MAAEPTSHERYRIAVKAKHKSCTPYRLGLAVGNAGDNLPSPYPAGSHGDRLYRDGVRYGRDARRRNVVMFPAPADGVGVADHQTVSAQSPMKGPK